MREIKLTQGQVALVSDEDFEQLSKYKWFAVKQIQRGIFYGYYARRNFRQENGKQGRQYMHRFLLGIDDVNLSCDHINGNKLDNQRNNIRIATMQQNMCNRKTPSNNSTGYKGVYWDKNSQKFNVRLRVNKKLMFFGCYDNPLVAAKVYDENAKRLHGEFAKLNFNKAV